MAGSAPTLEQQAISRKAEASEWKQRRLLDFRECYFFAAPSRQRQLSSGTQPSTTAMMDEPELNTDLAFLLVDDFVTEIVNTYLPEAQMWCERKAGEGFEEAFDDVKDDAKADDKKIFSAIKTSNFYAEIPKAFAPDLAIGTAALYIDRPKAHMAVQVLAVPLREIEINLGPDGEVDDRFIVRFERNTYVRKFIGEEAWAKVPEDLKKEIADNPKNRTECTKGWWRRWEDDRDECWQHVVLVKNRLVHSAELEGTGCCALLIMRFMPTADWPYAVGPLLKGLPTLRQVDELERQKVEAVERAVNPAIKYPDDSVTNIEQGIEPGMGYPVRPGAGEDFGAIYQQPSIEPALLEMETKEHRLKKLFYVDHPEQTGDTPPTLGQWLDELARMQRRIGTAGFSFWREGPMRIFLRFKYLLEVAGTIRKLADKGGRAIATQAYNPSQRAAEQQEIATAMQFSNMMAQMFPEEWRMAVDGRMTMEKFAEKMRVTGLIQFRDKKQVEGALEQIKQLIVGRQRAGGTDVAEGAGAPAAA
jgi:hypothetical protein